jgi:hypothetical protein
VILEIVESPFRECPSASEVLVDLQIKCPVRLSLSISLESQTHYERGINASHGSGHRSADQLNSDSESPTTSLMKQAIKYLSRDEALEKVATRI